MHRTPAPAEIRAIAVAGDAHPETVARYLTGAPVRPLSASRVERGLRAVGLAELVRTQPVTAEARAQ
jgi:hypothetical protein